MILCCVSIAKNKKKSVCCVATRENVAIKINIESSALLDHAIKPDNSPQQPQSQSHMVSTYSKMFVFCAITLLCLVSVSQPAPLACTDLVKPLQILDPHHLEGTWTLVAGSMKIIENDTAIIMSESTTLHYHNSRFLLANAFGGRCQYLSSVAEIEGHNYQAKVGLHVFMNGTFYATSCGDCVVMSYNLNTPTFKTTDFYLFSKRREVDQKELAEFVSQVECLNMPQHRVMDPSREPCPIPALAWEENKGWDCGAWCVHSANNICIQKHEMFWALFFLMVPSNKNNLIKNWNRVINEQFEFYCN